MCPCTARVKKYPEKYAWVQSIYLKHNETLFFLDFSMNTHIYIYVLKNSFATSQPTAPIQESIPHFAPRNSSEKLHGDWSVLT